LVRVVYTGVANSAAANSPSATYGGKVQQLSRIDDDDPVSSDVQSVFPAEKLRLLRHGLRLDDQALKPAKVEWQNPEQLRFVLTEGKKRQIRRMCELVGLRVVGLKRVRVGKVMLGNLPVGQWRYLQPHEKF
jgi:23S rRNA pseudouridine2604 synthase